MLGFVWMIERFRFFFLSKKFLASFWLTFIRSMSIVKEGWYVCVHEKGEETHGIARKKGRQGGRGGKEGVKGGREKIGERKEERNLKKKETRGRKRTKRWGKKGEEAGRKGTEGKG